MHLFCILNIYFEENGGIAMPIRYIQQTFIKYNKGKGFICGHVDALHAASPAADKYTDKMVEKLIKEIGCAGIIGTVSRMECDLNRRPNGSNDEGIQEYRGAVKDLLNFLQIIDPFTKKLTAPYLHLSFHGMKDTHYGPLGIEVGSLCGQSCSSTVQKWFQEKLIFKAQEISSEIKIVFNEKFIGDESIIFHRKGDLNGYLGYGEHFHTFQIELSRTLRRKYLTRISKIFSQIMTDFQTEFVALDRS